MISVVLPAAKKTSKQTKRTVPVPRNRNQRAAMAMPADMSASSLVRKLGGIALRKGGNMLGSMIAGPAGSSVGDWITGHGDYTINSNSILGGAQIPVFREGKRTILVKHREYLTDILSSTGFSLSAYNINPGLAATFPWLSSVAENFEQYRLHGLVFEFRSTAGSAVSSTNNALGTVIQSTEYNVNKPQFTSKQQMEAYEFSCSAKPSESFIHPIECMPSETQTNIFNVRSGPVPNQELRMYDLGLYQIATLGMQAGGVNVGELWVSYEVEFLKPVLPLSLYSALSATFSGGPYVSAGNNYFPTVLPAFAGSFIPVVSATGAGWDTVTFPSSVLTGTFFAVLSWGGAGTANTVPTCTLTNGIGVNKFAVNSVISISNTASTAARLFFVICFQVVNPTGTTPFKFVLTGGTLPGTPSSMDLNIMQVSDAF